MRPHVALLLTLSMILIGGCSLKNRVMGQYYLDSEKYREGLAAFEQEAQQNPDDWSANYYLGRFYLAENQPESAAQYLKKSAQLNPDRADTYFWLGVAYSQLKQPDLERESYMKALALDNRYLKARTYLAHNQLENGQYKAALQNYTAVLAIQPDIPEALYNRAVVLKRLGEKTKEVEALKQYLTYYPSGAYARRAVARLNQMGDFVYRNYPIGLRILTLKSVRFNPASATVRNDSRPSLAVLGAVLNNNKNAIHIVAYLKGNKELAQARAKSLKKYLLEQNPGIRPDRLKVSWFGIPETIKMNKIAVFTADESVNFFTAR